MKKFNSLNAVISFFYGFYLVMIVLSVLEVSKIILNFDFKTTIKINDVEFIPNDFMSKSLVILVLISNIIFVYSIYLFKKTTSFFLKKDVFNNEVIHNLKKIGQLILISSLIKGVPLFLFYTFHISKQYVSHKHSFLNLDFPLVCLAVFFMVLAEVFSMGKQLKEENDLTV